MPPRGAGAGCAQTLRSYARGRLRACRASRTSRNTFHAFVHAAAVRGARARAARKPFVLALAEACAPAARAEKRFARFRAGRRGARARTRAAPKPSIVRSAEASGSQGPRGPKTLSTISCGPRSDRAAGWDNTRLHQPPSAAKVSEKGRARRAFHRGRPAADSCRRECRLGFDAKAAKWQGSALRT